MTLGFYTNIISPHQLPFARELVKHVGEENYRYVYSEPFHAERAAMGWDIESASWILSEVDTSEVARAWLETCDVLICGHRDLDLIELRCRKGLQTYYASERWFKPIHGVTGRIRMLFPRYRRMVRRFVELVRRFESFKLLPYGVHAQQDFLKMGVPLERQILWGYFVAPSTEGAARAVRDSNAPLRVLWVGRLLGGKNVKTLVHAVRHLCAHGVPTELTIVGNGPEGMRLRRLSEGFPITFLTSVKIQDVRVLMRQHDVYVLPSSAMEGWGAVVSEALEEGMLVLGSNEAGASATILPPSHRFGCRDVKRLEKLLISAAEGRLARIPIGDWSAAKGAQRFLSLCGAVCKRAAN